MQTTTIQNPQVSNEMLLNIFPGFFAIFLIAKRVSTQQIIKNNPIPNSAAPALQAPPVFSANIGNAIKE